MKKPLALLLIISLLCGGLKPKESYATSYVLPVALIGMGLLALWKGNNDKKTAQKAADAQRQKMLEEIQRNEQELSQIRNFQGQQIIGNGYDDSQEHQGIRTNLPTSATQDTAAPASSPGEALAQDKSDTPPVAASAPAALTPPVAASAPAALTPPVKAPVPEKFSKTLLNKNAALHLFKIKDLNKIESKPEGEMVKAEEALDRYKGNKQQAAITHILHTLAQSGCDLKDLLAPASGETNNGSLKNMRDPQSWKSFFEVDTRVKDWKKMEALPTSTQDAMKQEYLRSLEPGSVIVYDCNAEEQKSLPPVEIVGSEGPNIKRKLWSYAATDPDLAGARCSKIAGIYTPVSNVCQTLEEKGL